MVKKVTMQDIANHLDISKNSVSQALSGKPGVSDETRLLIQETAEKMGYRYLSKGKQNTEMEMKNIALIASDYAFSLKSFFGEIYLSVEKELHKRGMNLLIQSINKHSKDNLLLPSIICNNEINGVLVLSHISTEYINKIINTGIPTVLIDHHDPAIHADAILTNNRFAAYTAVAHLIQLGHKDIAYIGNIDFSPSYEERLEGYLLALKAFGIKPKEELIFTNALENEENVNTSVENAKNQATAWFCVNDGLGFLVCSRLKQKGLKIPDQVSVVSFDNGQLSQIATPKITTMDVDLELYGRKAVELLCWRMDHINEPYQEILLPTKLIKRDSSGPLNKMDTK